MLRWLLIAVTTATFVRGIANKGDPPVGTLPWTDAIGNTSKWMAPARDGIDFLATWPDHPGGFSVGASSLLLASAALFALLWQRRRKCSHRPLRPAAIAGKETDLVAALTDLSAKLLEPEVRVERIAERVLHHARCLTGSEHGIVTAIDPETRQQVAQTPSPMRIAALAAAKPDAYDPSLAERVMNTREAFFTEQPSRPPEVPDGSIHSAPARNFLAVPAIVGDEILGQIALWNAPEAYSLEKLRLVQRLAELYGMFLRQYRLQRELQESETRFRRISSIVSDMAYSCSGTQHGHPAIDWITGAAERVTGYTLKEIEAMGCWCPLVYEEDRESFKKHVLSLKPESSGSCELRLRHKNGHLIWVASYAECARDERQPNRFRLYGALTDITQRHQAEEKMRLNAAVIESTRDGVVVTDLTPVIVSVNRAYLEMNGYTEEELLDRNPHVFQAGRHDARFFETIWAALRERGHWQGEIWNRRKNGEIYPEWQTISTVRDADGRPTHYVAVCTDISQRKQNEAQLERLAHYDPLTDLPNRLLVKSRLEHAMDGARRRKTMVAVLFIDLDRFKTINDSLGHPAGDALLIAVARRLSQRLRQEDTLGRLGGDEFLVILENVRAAEDVTVVARDLLGALQAPFTLPHGQDVYIRASVGISLYPKDGTTTEELIRNSDAAMYQVKDAGRNAYVYYTKELTYAAAERLRMETRLRRALEREEFLLYYQPIVSLADGSLVGAEALLRWQPPDEELVLPARFIRIAEETGLIVPLGEWVLHRTCAQAKAWLDAGLSFGPVALNLSVPQFRQRDLERLVRSALQDTALPASCLELELTEGCLMEYGEQAEQSLRAIKSLGVRLSIDDFGTGYSSLADLKRLPLDRLKIDYSFIRDIPDDPNGMAIASTVIAMARHLGLRAIAEGVETEAQLNFLRQQGCDAYQGFLHCRPLPAHEFAARYLRTAR